MDEHKETIKTPDRYLSPLDVWAMAFGFMVGWGVFAMPGNTFLRVAGPAGTLIAMGIGMVITLIIGSNFSFFMGRSSITGGIYSYTKEAFGRDHAFISCWFLCLSYLTIVFLNGTALFYIIRMLLGSALQTGVHYTIAGNVIYPAEALVSALVLGGVGLLFIVARPLLRRLHTVLSILLIAGVIVVTVACLPAAVSGSALTMFGSDGTGKGYAVFSLVILSPWAFAGFEVTSFDTAHFRFPIRRSWLPIALSIVGAAFAYTSMTLVSVAAVPDEFATWQEYVAALDGLTGIPSVPTFYAAGRIMGTAGVIIMIVTALSAILTGIIGGYRATTRVLSTMAEDRILSERFSKTSYSILFIMVISIVIAFLGRNTLNWFVDLTAFGAIVGFGYTSAAAWKIAKTEGNRKRVIFGIIGTTISLMFAVVQLIPHLTAMEAMGSEAFLLLSLWCLLGFVFYWRTVKYSTLTEYTGISASGTVLFALLVYAALMWVGKLIAGKESMEEVRSAMAGSGVVLIPIIFVGLVIMLYIQKLVRTKHEASEREKIRAVEGSLAKSRFLFNMSHDIRTPMNAIIGYTTLAKAENNPPTTREYLGKIEDSSQHLLALINDILEMSRIENGKVDLELAPEDLCAILDSVHDLFAEQMKQKKMDFSVHTSQVHHRYVWCDKKNLNRVLLNVLSNAFKFTPEGGTITASLYEINGVEEDYGSYELRVQDSGIGMSREFVERMWGAFERERTSTDSGVEGTGLGLAITKSIVDLMGGTIEVLTAPGSGTEIILRFKFRLAEKEELREENAAGEAAGGETMDFTGKRLLLVEDNAINLEIAKMILEQMGFVLETAENGQIAVDMVSASSPGYYDAVLMDIQMPVMDGYAATRAIRSLNDAALANVPILAMTANAFQEDVRAAMDAGMQAHIAKPIDIGAMMSALTKVLKNDQEQIKR